MALAYRLLIFLWALCAHPLTAQSARPSASVAIALTDSSRQFQSLFASELRKLGDIAVVSTAEDPTVVLAGVVLCRPDCRQPDAYSVSLRLYTPFRKGMALSLANEVREMFAQSAGPSTDSLSRFFANQLSGYERSHQLWAVNWGRNVYERAVRELVRELDSECFEQFRILGRLSPSVMATDSVTARALFREWMSKTWLC